MSSNSTCCGQLTVLLLVLAAAGAALGTRVILDPKIEPTIEETHHIYRNLFSPKSYWDLANAGVLEEADIGNQFKEQTADKRFVKTNFKFDSFKSLEWAAKLEYRIPLEERLALHVYDDARDVELAAGPQVNQQMCGLHLSYMVAMVRKHMVSIRNTSDFSIFRIMHSSDGPNFSLGLGNLMLLGNYDHCVGNKLNVMRDELAHINKTAADAFFTSRQRKVVPSFLRNLIDSLGPLVGYLNDPEPSALLYKNQDKIQQLDMRYCMAGLRYPEWRNDSFTRRNYNLRAAICLPETCDSRSLELYRDQIKQLVDFNVKQYYAGYYLDQLYCLPDEQSKLRNPLNFLDSTIFIMFNVAWLSLVGIATIVNSYKRQEEERQSGWWHYLSCWCLPKNYKQLMSSRQKMPTKGDDPSNGHQPRDKKGNCMKSNKVDLEPMEGFKVLSAIAVITSHSVMILFSNNWNLYDGHTLLSSTYVAVVNYLFPAVVDNFFVATGVLTVGVLMRMPRKQLQTKKFWPVFIIYRYLRIVPLYALVHWFIQSYFRFLGSGPKWDYGTSRTAWISMCQNESLWTLIFPMANFKSAGRHCNHVGWYLANDIHFCLLVPALILVYLKDHLMGHLVVAVSSVLVCLNHIWYYMTVDADARAVFEPSMIMLSQVVDEVWAGYVMPQYRCLAFLVGIAAGHVLIKYERGEIREWPRWLLVGGRIFMFINTYLLLFMPFISYMMPLDNEQLVLISGSVISGSMHGITSVAAAIFILFLCTGHLPMVAYFFSLDFLKPLANMALSTLLIHIPLLYYHSQSLTYLPKVSGYNIITTTMIWCIESYAISFVVHLIYEVPLRKILLKTLLGLLADRKPQASPAGDVELSESHAANLKGEDVVALTEPERKEK